MSENPPLSSSHCQRFRQVLVAASRVVEPSSIELLIDEEAVVVDVSLRILVDVDATFQLSAEWYQEVARSHPPKDQPWYHVLVDKSETTTYVAQRHLELEDSPEPIRHPMLAQFFSSFRAGRYQPDAQIN